MGNEKRKIMVVDDNASIANLLEISLAKMGYEVVGKGASGEEAIEMARRLRPHLILMDIVLPGRIDGIKASERIKEDLDIPIIFLTAYGHDRFVKRAKSVEPFGYIVKPFQMSEVKATIEIAFYKKEMSEMLLRSEERYRSVVDNAKEGIISTDNQGNIVSWNPSAEKIFGYSAHEAIGRPFNFILPERFLEADENGLEGIIPGLMPENTGKMVEMAGLRKDGSEFPMEFSLVNWETEEGSFFTCILRDITERKRMESELESSRASFYNIVERNADGILIVDRDGIVRYVNPVAQLILGREAKELTDKRFDFPLAAGGSIDIDITRRNGEKGIGEMRTVETMWNNESAYLISIRDITERKDMEEKLRKSEERAKAQFKSIPVPTFTWKKVGESFVLIDYNNIAEESLKKEITSVVGKTPEEIFPDIPEIKEDLSECFREKMPIKRELHREFGFKGKSDYFKLLYAYASPDEVILHVEDITREKEIERMKSEIVSNVSHELRTPLSIIKEGISLILDEVLGQTNEEQKDVLLRVMNGINRLTRLINNLLDISRYEAGKMELKKSMVDISSLAEEVLSSFKNQAEDKNVCLKTCFNIVQPEIFVDPDKINQVLTNLISNSLKFTGKDGQISVIIEDKGGEIEISVEDTGIGISKENIPSIFERFTQFDRVDGPGMKGTGLGLAISKEIVEMHKGRICVESEPGKGSKFTFNLPRLSQEDVFKEYLNSYVKESEEEETPLSLIIIRIKNLDEISDKRGVSEALTLVKRIEEIIKETLRRRSDIVLRYKEEGVIVGLLKDTPKKFVPSILKRMKNAVGAEMRKDSRMKDMFIILDKITFPDDAVDGDDLITKIDKIL